MQIAPIQVDGYEKVLRCRDASSGLHALIAVHDTTLGPALGGMRMLPYASEDEALFDVLRLAKGMTYKSAVAETGLGGGKSVVIGDPGRDKREPLFAAMGRFVEHLAGRYITAADMNIGDVELRQVRSQTRWVAGVAGMDGTSGNPSPYTALGCIEGYRAMLQELYGSEDFTGRHFVVQGVGAVGSRMVELLLERGARATVCDLDPARADGLAERLGCAVVADEDHLDVECDVYAPCARGATLNDDTIPRLRCRAVGGCANNQLLEPRHADALQARGILYAPDYVINAGGIINVGCEFLPGGYDERASLARIARIRTNLAHVFRLAREHKQTTREAAARLAEQRLDEGRSGPERRSAS
jgi:leucine dehydrogenase